MFEIETYNAEMVVLSDILARIQNRELDDAIEEDLPLRRDIWQLNAEREELWARFNRLNAILEWWSEQMNYVFSKATGPETSGFRAPSSGDGPPQPAATAQQWQSPRTLLHRLHHQPLERALKLWVDDLVERGMLSEEDAAQVQLDPPHDEHREKLLAEDRERLAQFEADFQKVLAKVERTAEKRGRHPGLPYRLALCLWNRRFAGIRKDRPTLNAFIKALEKEKLLPPLSATAKAATDLVKVLF